MKLTQNQLIGVLLQQRKEVLLPSQQAQFSKLLLEGFSFSLSQEESTVPFIYLFKCLSALGFLKQYTRQKRQNKSEDGQV